jgi:hypothetical protein
MKNIILAGAAALTLSASHTAYAAAQTNVMFILDASNSMWAQIDGKPKIEIAKKVLTDLVEEMPDNTAMGFIAYGHRFDYKLKQCGDMELMNPLGHFNRKNVASAFRFVTPKGQTPIADTLLESANWLEEHKGENTTLVLITDGVESCDGDPCAAASTLKDAGISTKIHVVGFDLSADERARVECISSNGDGRYFDARDAAELTVALEEVKKDIAEKTPVVVAQAEPAPKPEPAPAPSLSVHFEDKFDGGDLADHWEVANPNPDQYIIENESLLIIAKDVGGLPNAEISNLFTLVDDLPSKDWVITVELTPEYKTARDVFAIGAYTDSKQYIAATISANDGFCCDTGAAADAVVLQISKKSGDNVTFFDLPVVRPVRAGGAFVNYIEENNLNTKTVLQFIKDGRDYRARYHRIDQLDDKGQPVWVESESVTSLRPPKKLVINASQWGETAGESLFQVHSVKIETRQ